MKQSVEEEKRRQEKGCIRKWKEHGILGGEAAIPREGERRRDGWKEEESVNGWIE